MREYAGSRVCGARHAQSMFKANGAMLRICYSLAGLSSRWTLCGQLSGSWVEELRACWKDASAATSSQTVVDLSDVTFIDEKGERLLSEMKRAGVEFVAHGVETRHLLENLSAKGKRTLRRSFCREENTTGEN